MEGKLAALEQRVPIGEAEVRAVFGKGSKMVAGCMVTEGSLREGCFIVVSFTCLHFSACLLGHGSPLNAAWLMMHLETVRFACATSRLCTWVGDGN